MKNRRIACLNVIVSGVVWMCLASGAASQTKDPRQSLLEKVRNDRPTFYVRIDVDHANHVYFGGEEMKVSVSSEKPGYLYLFHIDASGGITCLFPNPYHRDNAIPAGNDVVTVPAPESQFRLRVAPPFGRETLIAIVSLVRLQEVRLQDLIRGEVTTRDIGKVAIEADRRPAAWAEHHLEIRTKDPSHPAADEPKRRVGVFIGIKTFRDPAIPGLEVSDKDAAAMADTMRGKGKLDKSLVLLDEKATRAAIEDVFCRQLADLTGPGDEIFIYWSGHGGQCVSLDPNKNNGVDEYLVPYDGRLDDEQAIRKTMLLDDTFGLWMLKLSGRRIAVILDACYAAGQHNQGKSSTASRSIAGDAHFDFFNVRRTRALGQKELAMLASSTANQESFERKEGDLSAMTYFLVRQLKQATVPVSLDEAFRSVRHDVPKYVEENFPGSTQTPIFVNAMTTPIYLQP
jgi:hypothetical protein